LRQFQNTASAEQTHDYPEADKPSPPSSDEPVFKFADLGTRGLVNPNVIQAITRNMGLETMTEVQTATIHAALKGSDM